MLRCDIRSEVFALSSDGEAMWLAVISHCSISVFSAVEYYSSISKTLQTKRRCLVTYFDAGKDGRRKLDWIVFLGLGIRGLDQQFGISVQRRHCCGRYGAFEQPIRRTGVAVPKGRCCSRLRASSSSNEQFHRP